MLAGGAGRRLGGGGKASVQLAGRPMLAYPLEALRTVLADVAVVAKADTELPELPRGVELWTEPACPRHPLTGIVEALRRARGRAVVVCAVDLPLVDAGLVRGLVAAPDRGAPAVVACAGGRPQPLLGRYQPAALAPLAAAEPEAAVTETVKALRPELLCVEEDQLLNVNDPKDLDRAAEALRARP